MIKKFLTLNFYLISTILIICISLYSIIEQSYHQTISNNLETLLDKDISNGDLFTINERVSRLEGVIDFKCFEIKKDQETFHKFPAEKGCLGVKSLILISKKERPDIEIFIKTRIPQNLQIFIIILLILIFILFVSLLIVNKKKILYQQQTHLRETKLLKNQAYQVAHDLRNPLQVLEFCQKYVDREYLDFFNKAIHRINSKIDSLLNERKESELVDVNSSLEIVIREKRILSPTIEINYVGENCEMELNKTQSLVAIVENMIKNSIEAGAKTIDVNLSKSFSSFNISISDNGPGIPQDIREKIYKGESITTKVDGNGLGLSQAYRWLTDMKGTIQIESIPGKLKINMTIPFS